MITQIGKEAVAGFAAGDGTVDQVALQLDGGEVLKHVVVRANGGNSGVIMVGHSANAVANGFVLAHGEQTPPIYVNDRKKIWLIGSADGQGFSWISS